MSTHTIEGIGDVEVTVDGDTATLLVPGSDGIQYLVKVPAAKLEAVLAGGAAAINAAMTGSVQ